MAQNLRYRIEAGDARSLDYRGDGRAAPSILVERIEYDYPEYTGYVDRERRRASGDIRAIEGTRVTIHARANGPIKQADVDFDADGRRDLDDAGQRRRCARQRSSWRCATIGKRRSTRATCCDSRTRRAEQIAIR